MPGENDPGLAMAQSMMSEELKKMFAPAPTTYDPFAGNASREMPRYESHKRVWALKIKIVLPDEWGVGLQFEEPGFAVRAFTNEQLKNKPVPQAGMYMVQYEDGYISFSPGKAFEEGYTICRY